MTTGIYCLSFESINGVYIGQAINIENRFKRHIRALKLEQADSSRKHKNYKMYNAYIKYGEPDISILEVCSEAELDMKECTWIEEFDSINNGLNICSGGKAGRGPDTGASRYSREQILDIFEMLLIPENTYMNIAKEVCVPIHVVQSISSSTIHNWLQDAYPDKYATMVSHRGARKHNSNNIGHLKLTAEAIGCVYPIIIDTKGVEYKINSIRGFSTEHGIDGGNLIKLLNGVHKTCKGFRLKSASDVTIRSKKVYGSILSPEGTVYKDITNIKEFSEKHGLCSSSIGKVLRGSRPQYKGWKLIPYIDAEHTPYKAKLSFNKE